MLWLIQLFVFVGSDCNNWIILIIIILTPILVWAIPTVTNNKEIRIHNTMENVKFILKLLSKFQAPICTVSYVMGVRVDRQTDKQTPAPPYIIQTHLTPKKCRNHVWKYRLHSQSILICDNWNGIWNLYSTKYLWCLRFSCTLCEDWCLFGCDTVCSGRGCQHFREVLKLCNTMGIGLLANWWHLW
jgi:hypothetical protein